MGETAISDGSLQQEVTDWVEKKMPQIVQDLARICRIPSIAEVGEEKQPPFGKECVRVLREMLSLGQEYGFETTDFDSCVGRIRYGSGEKSIGIWSHLDVVETKEGWQYSPFSPVVRQGYFIARGCQDNKSSGIMALYVLLYMKEHGLKPVNSLDAYYGTCEEQGMYDLDYFIEKYPCPDLSLVPDSGFPVCCGERGSFNGVLCAKEPAGERLLELTCDNGLYEVPKLASAVIMDSPGARKLAEECKAHDRKDVRMEEIKGEQKVWRLTCMGVRAHGAAPGAGKNALTTLLSLLCEYELTEEKDRRLCSFIAGLNHDKNGERLGVACADALSGQNILTVTQGNLTDGHLTFGFMSKYPVSCGDYPMEEQASRAAEQAGFALTVTRYSKPSLFDPGHPAVKIMTDAYNQVAGLSEEPFVMSGGTYARKLPRAFACGTGMPLPPAPAGLFLPGHGDYHQPDEAISLERIRKALIIYIMGILQIDQKVSL